jgi:molybdenum cofactor biosynthesis enzyme MoaA
MWRNELKEKEFGKNWNREAPVFANINLLGKCNVDCYFCLGKDIDEQFGKQDQTALHFYQWPNFYEFLKRCQAAGIKNIYLTGQNTDALLYRHAGELVDYLQESWSFNAGLRTNGYRAPQMLDVVNKCRRSVGYSIHSLDPETNWKIMRRRDIPDWQSIIPATKNVRVSTVLNRHNAGEYFDLLKFVSQFENVKYIQTRRICTDIREDYLIEDVRVYEEVFERVKKEFPLVGHFYSAEVFKIFGKEVVFWRTVKTTIESFNYYTDGTINEEYFVIEGYMRESQNYPKDAGVPVKEPGLEGYWRDRRPVQIQRRAVTPDPRA